MPASGGAPASMKFVRDVNLSDRTPVSGNTILIKRWLVENDGSAKWPNGSKLIFIRGDRELVDSEEFPIECADEGKQVEVSAVLKTPQMPGRYQAFFRLADKERNVFGQRLWTDLIVMPESNGAVNEPVNASSAPSVVPSAPLAESSSSPSALNVPVVIVPLAKSEPTVEPTPVLVKPIILDASNDEDDEKSSSQVEIPILVKPIIEEPVSIPSSSSSSSSSSVAPSEGSDRYATELALLSGMGFNNRELNVFLLDSKQGDLVAVANWLLEKMK